MRDIRCTVGAFLVQWRSPSLAADRAGPAGGAACCDGHSVLVPSREERVPVGDERQPHVLPPLHHVLGHEFLHVRVATRYREPSTGASTIVGYYFLK